MSVKFLAGGAILVWAVGCTAADHYQRMLGSPDPAERAAAAGWLGTLGDPRAVPWLIDRLYDEDPVVRTQANRSLCRLTGQDFGYQPNAPPAQRRQAAQRWWDWWASQTPGRAGPAPASGPSPSGARP